MPAKTQPASHLDARSELLQAYLNIRANSEALCAPLRTEDYVLQSMPDASPAKWHLAHVTWFFEEFILKPYCADYRVFDPQYAYLFNSYYVSLGERHTRAERGLLSRPTVSQIMDYRQYVDEALGEWLLELEPAALAEIEALLVLGLNHEQQHQELLLMDIKHLFSKNPLYPSYREAGASASKHCQSGWKRMKAGIVECGHRQNGFGYDNESPRHPELLADYEISLDLISNEEWLAFIDDGGYQNPKHWLSDGWAWRDEENIEAPLYWLKKAQQWQLFSLNGLQALDAKAPVCHISYYEADAYARWAGARLPTEFEWEAAAPEPQDEAPALQPQDCQAWYGQVWQWTSSAYAPYPGFKTLSGSAGEYNGKFMSNQMVMRGSACITPPGHSRRSYRNFFYPHMRWQFGGLRLAR